VDASEKFLYKYSFGVTDEGFIIFDFWESAKHDLSPAHFLGILQIESTFTEKQANIQQIRHDQEVYFPPIAWRWAWLNWISRLIWFLASLASRWLC
jgi:hypothetical protein